MDEIQTGFGRTGRFFGFEHSGITPDIVCLGKSFGGGMMPISAVLASEKVWTGCVIAPLSFGSSLGGNPLACAIGLATIEIARDPAFLETVTKHGSWVGAQLDTLAKSHPALIKQHRGIGLFHGLELHDPAVAGLVLWLLFEEGVISAFCLGNPFVIRIEPPLVMDRETLEQSMEKLALALRKAQAYLETIPRDSIGHSRFSWTEEVGAPPDALMAILGDHRRFYEVAPVVRHAEPVAANVFRCRGRLDNLELEWVERLQLERDAQRVTQEVTEGDFVAFRRVTTVTLLPGAPARSRISVDVSWDAGTELFERVLGLRLRYSLEKAVRDGIARLRGAARVTD
jgi:putrescine aminotransferase